MYYKGTKYGIIGAGGFRLSEKFMEVGKRVHLAGVRTDTHVRLYVDGKLWVEYEAAPLAKEGALAPDAKLTLGPTSDGVAFRIRDVRVSQGARYTKEFAPPARIDTDKDTLALYRCDEGAGDALKDSSGNNKHAKIANPKWWKPDAVEVPK